MTRTYTNGVLVAAILLIGGCDLVAALLPGRTASADRGVVVVREGRSTPLPDGRGSLHYVAKTEESRCPRGAECVHAGEAQIHVELRLEGREVQTTQLRIPGFVDATSDSGHESVRMGDYYLTLLELTPYPDVSTEPAPDNSVATIRVRPARRP